MRTYPRTTPCLPIPLLLGVLAVAGLPAPADSASPVGVPSGAGGESRSLPVEAPAGTQVIRELARLDERLELGTFPNASPLWPARVAAALEHLLRSGAAPEKPASHLLRRLAVELRHLGTEHGLDAPPERWERWVAPSDAPGMAREERLRRVLETIRRVHGKLDREEGGGPSAGGLVPRVAPGNDDCASAYVVEVGTVTGSTTAATNDGSASCGSSSTTPDVWYSFTAPSSDTYRFNTFGSSFDTVLSLWDACDAGDGRSTEIACNDDAGTGSQSEIAHTLAAGETVLVRVGGFSGATGDFTLNVLRNQGISGTVTRADTGAPLAGVTIRLSDYFGGPPADAVTENDGSYFVFQSAGTYYVQTDNDAGFLDEAYDDVPCGFYTFCAPGENGTPVTVSAGVTSGIDFALEPAGSLSGTLTDAATGDPLDGFAFVYGLAGELLTSLFTGPDGAWTVTGVPAEKFYVGGQALGYRSEIYDDVPCSYPCDPTLGIQVEVTTGAHVTGIDLALDARPTIEGLVTEAGSGDPVAFERVNLFDADGDWIDWALIRSDGWYRFDTMPDGTYFVRTATETHRDELYDDLPCEPSCTVTAGTGVVAEFGPPTTGIDFVLIPFGKVSGTVTEAGSGAPLFAFVRAYDASGTSVWSAPTESDGTYTIERLPTGSYFLRTESATHENELYDDVPCPPFCDPTAGNPVATTDGSTTSGIDFVLRRRGSIAGRITHSLSGAPVSGAGISLFDSSFTINPGTTTAPDGTYEVEDLPAGSYYVRTVDSLYQDEVYPDLPCTGGCDVTPGTLVEVRPEATTSGIDLALDRLGFISGTVTAAGTGEPLEPGIVVLRPNGNQAASGPAPGGSFMIEGLEPGTYYVKATTAWGAPGHQDELFEGVPCDPFCDLTAGTLLPVALNGGAAGVDLTLTPCPVGTNATYAQISFFGTLTIEACERVTGIGVTVKPGANVTFKAGRTVVLEDGFRVESGGRFRAVIEPAWAGD